jgi:hypothetical protein
LVFQAGLFGFSFRIWTTGFSIGLDLVFVLRIFGLNGFSGRFGFSVDIGTLLVFQLRYWITLLMTQRCTRDPVFENRFRLTESFFRSMGVKAKTLENNKISNTLG